MLSCEDARRSILRAVDGDRGPDAELETHLAGCAACRAALEDQRVVSRVLRERPADTVSATFAARLDARLDEVTGWLGIADWRAWTIRLSPALAALALAAFLSSDSATAAPGLAEWTMSGPEAATEAALLWQPGASPEEVIQSMLGAPGAGDPADAR